MPDPPPLSLRAQAKREQILGAARTQFLGQGYARTSTDALAAAAGVSKQTLYAYFPGKTELLAAVVERELGDLNVGGAAGTPSSLPELRARLLGFSLALTTHLVQPDALALLRLLLGEAAHLPEVRTLTRQAVPGRLLAGAAALLAAAHGRGLISAPDPDLSARMLVGPVMSFVMLDGFFGDGLPDPPSEATLGRLIDLFLRSVEVQRHERD